MKVIFSQLYLGWQVLQVCTSYMYLVLHKDEEVSLPSSAHSQVVGVLLLGELSIITAWRGKGVKFSAMVKGFF